MKPTPKGRVTSPLNARILKTARADQKGRRLIEAMRRAPKPRPGMTTDQLMALTRGE